MGPPIKYFPESGMINSIHQRDQIGWLGTQLPGRSLKQASKAAILSEGAQYDNLGFSAAWEMQRPRGISTEEFVTEI
jgi:hypothetical protein